MSLKEYKRKRKFDVTAEPSGSEGKPSGNSFVVQKHAATRLHYDFRLEHKGVLKSWAVPHGPCLDPTVKSLAVHVEDHPVDYAGFEGTIPKGEYGGGTVMVWDRGTWESIDEDIDKAFARGKISFRLNGEKLRGAWSLVQMKSRGEDNWLLLKRTDEFSIDRKKFDVLAEESKSVLTGRDLSQIADGEKPVQRRARARERTQVSVTQKLPSSPKRSKPQAQTASRELAKHLRNAPSGTLPEVIEPQLATLTNRMPSSNDWLHEIKLDGYRILARIDRSNATSRKTGEQQAGRAQKAGRAEAVRLFTRSGLDWTDRFSVIASAVAELPVDQAWLDGEIVALNGSGISDFQRLQNSLSEKDPSALVYYVFDMPWAEGKDLTQLPLVERKQVLSQLFAKSASKFVRYHEHIVGAGDEVLGKACGMSLEGLVSKRSDSPYVPRRSDTWLKIKCVHNQEFVICGYSDPEGERTGFGALLLGYYEDARLVYCGRVGTGFNETSLRQLIGKFKKLTVKECPFDVAPNRQQQRGVHWLKPTLVAEISYATRTADGLLRQSVFHGLREDKVAREVILEKPVLSPRSDHARPTAASQPTTPTAARKRVKQAARGRQQTESSDSVEGVEITHPDRVVYDELGITKLQLAQYLAAVGKWILPELAGRPLTLLRCPSGAQGKCFYQKHLEEQLPDGVRGVVIQEDKKSATYPVIEDLQGLIELVQRSVLEFHIWPVKADNLEHPDRLIFDLDPGESCSWKWVVEAAQDLRSALKQTGLASFLRTSGGKGLHVVVPIKAGSCNWDELKEFASLVAHSFAEQFPKRYVATISKAARRGRVFIDYLRNGRGATAIASYSPRARAAAGVAMPISWRQLSESIQGDQFTVETVPKLLTKRKADPWKGFTDQAEPLPRISHPR